MWPDSEETLELLSEAQAGDDRAINSLMERHRESLRRMIQMRMDRAIAQRVDASDLVQNVLLEANQRLSDYISSESRLPFHLWLRQLAKDQIIDMYRYHRLAQKRSVDREQSPFSTPENEESAVDLMKQLVDDQLTPAAANLRNEMHERFLQGIAQLNEDDQDIIVMRHFEHLSNAEVARALELTPSAAGMRYLRALRKLKDLLMKTR